MTAGIEVIVLQSFIHFNQFRMHRGVNTAIDSISEELRAPPPQDSSIKGVSQTLRYPNSQRSKWLLSAFAARTELPNAANRCEENR